MPWVGTYTCECCRISTIIDRIHTRNQPMLRRLIRLLIRLNIIIQKHRIPRMHIQHIIRAIRNIHKTQRLVAPVRNVPHLLLAAVRRTHARLRLGAGLLGGEAAHAQLLGDARLVVAQRIAALDGGGDGEELPVLLDDRVDDDGAVVGDDLEGGLELGLVVVVDAAFGDVVPDVGVEDGGDVFFGHCDG